MKKIYQRAILCSILSILANSFVQCANVEQVAKNMDLLGQLLADPNSGLLADLDRAKMHVKKIQAFKKCAAASRQTKKPYSSIKVASADKTVTISCVDYKDVLDAVKFLIEFISEKAIGTDKKLGLLSGILTVMEASGVSGDNLKKVNTTVYDIQLLMDALVKLLSGLETRIKVPAGAKAV